MSLAKKAEICPVGPVISFAKKQKISGRGLELKDSLNNGDLKACKVFTHHLTHHRTQTIL